MTIDSESCAAWRSASSPDKPACLGAFRIPSARRELAPGCRPNRGSKNARVAASSGRPDDRRPWRVIAPRGDCSLVAFIRGSMEKGVQPTPGRSLALTRFRSLHVRLLSRSLVPLHPKPPRQLSWQAIAVPRDLETIELIRVPRPYRFGGGRLKQIHEEPHSRCAGSRPRVIVVPNF